MRKWRMATVLALVGAGLVAGVAYATHQFPAQLPPQSAAQGFLVSNSRIENIPVDSFAGAVKPDGSRLFVNHITRTPGFVNNWHRHPGLILNMVITGSITLERARGSECLRETYTPGQGFSERTGDVVRTIAGPSGAEYYVVYVLPPDAHATGTPAGSEPTPRPCV
jgi:quercetin dioxygenase-like cupin family protein